jgi:TM2 domain-containing membrane protein YozV
LLGTQYVAFCPNCGNKVPDDAQFCPNCAAALQPQTAAPAGQTPVVQSMGRTNTLVAVVLSVILSGLGQLYLGVRKRGLVFVVVGVILIVWFAVMGVGDIYPLFWAYGIYDTLKIAARVSGKPSRIKPVIVLIILEILAVIFFVGSLIG